jgi:uncharacterized protein YeaO (DUF488 family)
MIPRNGQSSKTRYRAELKHNSEQLAVLKQAIAKGPVTLLYGAKDEQRNDAIVLQELLRH